MCTGLPHVSVFSVPALPAFFVSSKFYQNQHELNDITTASLCETKLFFIHLYIPTVITIIECLVSNLYLSSPKRNRESYQFQRCGWRLKTVRHQKVLNWTKKPSTRIYFFKSIFLTDTRETRSYPSTLYLFLTLSNQIWQHKCQNVSHLTGSNLQFIDGRHEKWGLKIGWQTSLSSSWLSCIWCETTGKRANRRGGGRLQ